MTESIYSMGITTECSLVLVLYGLCDHTLVVGSFEDDFQIFTIIRIDTVHLSASDGRDVFFLVLAVECPSSLEGDIPKQVEMWP